MARLSLLFLVLALQDSRPAWQERLERFSASPEGWLARRREIRERILTSAGLWPEFERPAMRPDVFGKVEGEGYSIERVRLETWPGFYLTGNLYRPRGKPSPFPAIVSPHGHWKEGRFTQTLVANL